MCAFSSARGSGLICEDKMKEQESLNQARMENLGGGAMWGEPCGGGVGMAGPRLCAFNSCRARQLMTSIISQFVRAPDVLSGGGMAATQWPLLPQPTVSGGLYPQPQCCHRAVREGPGARLGLTGTEWWPRRLSGIPVGTFQPDAMTPSALRSSLFTPSSDQCLVCITPVCCHIGAHLE